MKIHWWWANSLKLLIDIISINFKAARIKLGFFEISLAICTFTRFLLKICMRKASIMGQISMKSWFKAISESLSIRIRIENKIKISNAGWEDSACLITSAIFSNSPLILDAYLSSLPEKRMKQILSKLLILFLF